MKLCPYKFSHYEFEGGQDCIGSECGMHKLCNANDTLAAENDVSAASVDANDVNAMQDSREKLEADACTFVARAWEAGRNFERRDLSTRSEDVVWSSDELIDLLDRQAEITEAEQREWWSDVVAELHELERENAKLSSDGLHLRNALAQSEHELATLRDKLGRMLDNAHEITRIGGDC